MAAHNLYVVWAAVGPLAGVILGGLLTAWWQRRHYLLDNKAREYREALDALNTYRQRLLSYQAKYAGVLTVTDARKTNEDAVALGLAQVHLDNVLADWIFTFKAVADSGVRDALMEFYRSQIGASPPGITEATQAIADMHVRLLDTAVTDLGLKQLSLK